MANCEICGGILKTRTLLNCTFPTMIGHEECTKILNKRDELEKKERQKKQAEQENLERLEIGFAGSSINWNARSFEQWVENSDNKPVVEFLKAWGTCTKGLVLSGTVGVGKTHLLAATANHLASRGFKFRFHRFSVWADKIRAVDFSTAEQMILEASDVSLLFLDDLGSATITDHVEAKFCRILDHRLEFNKPLFCSTNLTEIELKSFFSPRIVSRLLGLCEWIELSNFKKDWRIYG
jgi:DNA replication protein DnaC